MENLKLVTERSAELELLSEQETLLLSALDVENNRLFFASSTNVLHTVHLPSSHKGRQWSEGPLASKAEAIDLDPGDCIAAMDYLMEREALILGTSDGCILLYAIDSKTPEVVGRVEGGVRNIASSPDGALIAITAGLGQLLVMTIDWEVLYETASDPQLSHDLVAGDLSDSQLQSPISWRGDGKYFATLSRKEFSSSHQKLMIWERESGKLLSTSESRDFIGSSLDWMPSGAKIAAAYDRRAEKKCPVVVFFEKNGLERNSFAVDEPVEATIKILKWSPNSDLLVASVSCDGYDAIKIWSFSNNHWYLKQEIRYAKKDGVKFLWDPTKPLHLICWTLGGRIMSYNFVWTTAVTEPSVALLIDGSSLLVTHLALSLMPPPMSLFSLKFRGAVQSVAFLANDAKNYLAASLSDGSLCVAELPRADEWLQFEGKEVGIDISHADLIIWPMMHLTWLDSHILLGISCYKAEHCPTGSIKVNELYHQDSKCSHYLLHEIEVVCSEDSLPGSVNSSGWHGKIIRTLSLKTPVIDVVPNPARRCSAFVQMDGGSILEYSSDINTYSPESCLHDIDANNGFSSSCPWMRAVLVRDNGFKKPVVLGLSETGRLHLDRKILCDNCCSFSFFSITSQVTEQLVSHLLITTKQDLLFIVSIDNMLHGDLEEKFETHTGNPNHRGENKHYVHIWERGAKLIGVIHGDEAAVILQTMRGNLECIYPRKLVLVSITNALVQRRFKDAMLMVRRHRIDFNIIVDFCGWQTFLKSSAEFVSQVNNLDHITEFVSAIKNENVMETLYKSHISFPSSNDPSSGFLDTSQSFGTKSKVSSVLLAVRKALEEQVQEIPARELCILTTLSRSEPPALEEALKRIKVIREIELSGVDDGRRKLYPSAEESLKHLLWLTDPEAVYGAALGLYDLNLAAIVALNSQKDPKEFLPFLRGLEQMPPVIMKYTIDLKLDRYENALKHIVSAGNDYYEDCINLLKNNPELFPLGLQLLTDNVKRKQVLEAWGNHLHSEKCFEDAATTYLCCSSFDKALKAYRACGDWKGAFTVAGLLGLGKVEILHLANELCEEFLALGKPAEAARIALDYCADLAKSVAYFVMAREWEEALRVGYMAEKEDLVSSVKDGALECASSLISEYKEGTEKVGKYLARYLAVRQRRLVLAFKIKCEDRPMNDADYDSVSEVSTSFSEMSAYTTRTAKNSSASISSSAASKARETRRQRSKGGKIRAGSPGEELALVDHLKAMSLTDSAERELKSLVRALVMLGKEENARQLQCVVETFQLSQYAAVKLAEDTMSSETIDESSHTLEHYMKRIRLAPRPQCLHWQSKILLSPG